MLPSSTTPSTARPQRAAHVELGQRVVGEEGDVGIPEAGKEAGAHQRAEAEGRQSAIAIASGGLTHREGGGVHKGVGHEDRAAEHTDGQRRAEPRQLREAARLGGTSRHQRVGADQALHIGDAGLGMAQRERAGALEAPRERCRCSPAPSRRRLPPPSLPALPSRRSRRPPPRRRRPSGIRAPPEERGKVLALHDANDADDDDGERGRERHRAERLADRRRAHRAPKNETRIAAAHHTPCPVERPTSDAAMKEKMRQDESAPASAQRVELEARADEREEGRGDEA